MTKQSILEAFVDITAVSFLMELEREGETERDLGTEIYVYEIFFSDIEIIQAMCLGKCELYGERWVSCSYAPVHLFLVYA